MNILRRLELDRLDALQAALWDKALAADITALRIIEQRVKLLGLAREHRPDPGAGQPTTVVVPGPAETWFRLEPGPA